MWLAAFLTLLSLLFLGLSSFYHSEFILHRTVDKKTVVEIVEIKNNFVLSNRPLFQSSLRDLPQFSLDFELIDTAGLLPQTHQYPYPQIKALFAGMKNCHWPLLSDIHPSLTKAFTLQQYLCAQSSELPENFFERPPYLHPLGFSYVFQAFHTIKEGDEKWLSRYRNYTHVRELPYLKDEAKLELDAWSLLLSQLSDQYYAMVLDGLPTILTTDKLLISIGRTDNDDFPVYLVFNRQDFSNYLSQSNFLVSDDAEQDFCLYTEGNMSWYLNRSFLEDLSTRYLYLSGISFLFLLVIVLWLAFQHIQRKIIEHRDRSFILRTLTHELRTPVTSLHMGMESLRKCFDQLPEEGQIGFLRMGDSIRRLKRVIEISSQYLYSERGRKGVLFNLARHESLNEVLYDALDQHLADINFTPLSVDSSFTLDVYWFTVCVRNLIENALNHGVPPIEVRAELQKNIFILKVIDQGQIPKKELQKYLRPFARHYSHENLGLGLSLVVTLVRQMGGCFELKACPTTMVIKLKDVRKKE